MSFFISVNRLSEINSTKISPQWTVSIISKTLIVQFIRLIQFMNVYIVYCIFKISLVELEQVYFS